MPMHPKPIAPTSGPLVPSLRCLTSLAPSYQFDHPALRCVSHQKLYRAAALRATPRSASGLTHLLEVPCSLSILLYRLLYRSKLSLRELAKRKTFFGCPMLGVSHYS